MALLDRHSASAPLATTIIIGAGLLIAGCATQQPPIVVGEAMPALSAQRSAQQATHSAAASIQPVLKRKLALGRVSNETSYGRSLLRDSAGDPLGKQVTDLLSKALTSSGDFLVFERPDIARLKDESELTGVKLDVVGVDALVVGSLTEFGRKTIGQTGFASSSKRQVAFAKIDLRVVDASTGQVLQAASGAGESSSEVASTFGFGSQAAYDGTLNDSAIRQAVSEAVNQLTASLNARPWQTSILSVDQGRCFIAGGKAQGLRPGMLFSVQRAGEKIKSAQSGFEVQLPGREVAQIRIESNFGDAEANEGSVASIVSGSVDGLKTEQLVVRIKESS